MSHSEQAQVPFIQRVLGSIFGFFNSLAVRLVIIFLAALLTMAVISDVVYPRMASGFANQLVVNLAEGAKKRLPTSSEILQTINQYNLAWLYVTGGDGKVVAATKPYAPTLASYGIAPRELDWKGKHYFEAVESLGNGQVLHLGVYAGQVFLPNLSSGEIALNVPLSLGRLGLIALGLLIICMVALQMCVSKPLMHLSRACYSLLLARDAYSHITGGGLNVPGAVSEVKAVSVGLKDIRRQYDEAVAARAAKDEELKRTKTEFEEEKTFMTRQYEDQLTQSEQRYTEVTTKEAETEFLNSLGKELDNMKSSQLLCNRVLEKLNDKFPTSVIFGVFFKVNKAHECSVQSFIGFDERSVQFLKKMDHTMIARQVFSTGQHLTIGQQAMRDYGLTQLAQANSIRNAVYMPVIFQNRHLGMLAFYFVQEGQTVQERLRVLRNAVDLTARSLYQSVLYEEETEAARTDPMTGLRNKKFFYEIMPQVFERASIKPEANPISIIMIDGDHFKAINDTYGHQIGDLMLQELAKTIKTCVRTNDSLERSAGPGDYLVRFGGEEFVVVMEMTDSQRACAVAERIRAAVENKSDWPGGIIRWTVSLGVSTYPQDGKNADDLMAKADTALYYVKEELDRNKVCHSSQVPRTFKAKKTAANIGGELGVFDAAGLLQSIATSMKTGVLTVNSGDGKNLWMLFEAGKPIQARMGKMAGNPAITEFLVTFEDGSFNFQEQVQTASGTRMPKLDDSYNVTRSLERALMDGALAQDNYNAARTIISSSEVYIRPIAKDEFTARWNALGQLEDPPSPEEFSAMTEIVKRSDGNSTLSKIFKGLEPMPTHLMWRGAALMVQHGLVETKPA